MPLSMLMLNETLNGRPYAIRRSEGETAGTAYDVYRQRVPDGPYAVKSAAKTHNFHKTVNDAGAYVP